jgi:PilZ domain-containing protein
MDHTRVPDSTSQDRRRQRRTWVPGIAVVRVDGQPSSAWRIVNLSLGGASLEGDGALPVAPFSLGLYVAGCEAVDVNARILRKQVVTRAGRCAIRFSELTEAQRRALEGILSVEHAPSLTRRRALVVDREDGHARALVPELAAMGFTVRAESSPEHAAAWLQKESAEVLLASERAIELNRWSLLQFVRDTAPETRRLIVADAVRGFGLYYAMKAGLVEGLIDPALPAETLAQHLLGTPPATSSRTSGPRRLRGPAARSPARPASRR